MLLKKNNVKLHSVSLRLTAWYTGLFVTGILIYFFMAFLSMSLTMKKHDRNHILELVAGYQKNVGLKPQELLDKLLESAQWDAAQNLFLILTGKDNKHIFVSLPTGWTSNDLRQVDYLKIFSGPESWQEFSRPAQADTKSFLFRKLFMADPDRVEFLYKKIGSDYRLLIGKTQAEQYYKIKNFFMVSLAILVPLIVLSFMCGIFLTRKALKPVKELISTIRQVRNGSVESRVDVLPTGDEFEDLARIFNTMLDRVETVINEMSEALDSLAHDIRTPLTRMRGTVEAVLQKEASPDELHEALQDCAEETERITAIINTLLDISEIETGVKKLELKTVDLSSLVEELIEMYQIVAEEKGIELSSQFDAPVYVEVDAESIGQAIANIIDNGINYTEQYGHIMVALHESETEVVLTINDAGIGIGPNILPKIFNRLYRGPQDKRQKGVGLGLSFAKAIVTAHNGRVIVTSAPDHGTEFKIFLPKKSCLED